MYTRALSFSGLCPFPTHLNFIQEFTLLTFSLSPLTESTGSKRIGKVC